MKGPRPGRKIGDILQDFEWSRSDDPGRMLVIETRHFVQNFRQNHPDQVAETFESLPLNLSNTFLTNRGDHYFNAASKYWTWPQDSDEIIRRITELMIRLNRYICEGRRQPVNRGKRVRGFIQVSEETHRETATHQTEAPLDLLPQNSTLVDEHTEIPGSPELPQGYIDLELTTILSDKDYWSISSSVTDSRGISGTSADVDTDSIPLPRLRDRQRTRRSIPQTPMLAHSAYLTTSDTSLQHGATGVPDRAERIRLVTHNRYDSAPERTQEDEPCKAFSIDLCMNNYALSGDRCAQVLGSTIARLEILRASSRLNNGGLSECLTKVEDLLRRIAGDMEQHSR